MSFRLLLVDYVRFSPCKEKIGRLRRKKGTRVSASPRVSPLITASAQKTPAGVDGQAARRARPEAEESRFSSRYDLIEKTNFGGAPPRLPPV